MARGAATPRSRTNPIGSGTSNLSVNAPVDWVRELGRAAHRAGVSLGEFSRRVIESGIERHDQEAAARLRNIRRQYYGGALLILFTTSMVLTWFTHDEQLARRFTRNNRSSRSARRMEQFIETEVEEEAA